MSSAEYYALKVRPVYKTYPVYAPGREPAGYREHLKSLEPEIIFDPAKLRSESYWIAAGKAVFASEPRVFPAGLFRERVTSSGRRACWRWASTPARAAIPV